MAAITDDGMIGFDSTVEVETTTGVWFELGLVGNVTPPNEQVDEVDITHMKSPDATRQFIQGLANPGDMTMDINYVPGNDTDEYIIAWRASRETRNVRITYPTDVVDTFPAFVKGYAPSLAVGDKSGAQLTLKVAGAVTRS